MNHSLRSTRSDESSRLLVDTGIVGNRTACAHRLTQVWGFIPGFLTSILSAFMYINPPLVMIQTYGQYGVRLISVGVAIYFFGVGVLSCARKHVMDSDAVIEVLNACSSDVAVACDTWDRRGAYIRSIVISVAWTCFMGLFYLIWKPSWLQGALFASTALAHVLFTFAISPLDITIALSHDMVHTYELKIRAWPNEDERNSDDEHFWRIMLDEYRSMDDALEKLWSAAAPYLVCVLAMDLFVCFFTFSVVLSAKSRLYDSGAVLFAIQSSFAMLRTLYKLSNITRKCTSVSQFAGSILRAAFDKSGMNNTMTETQRFDHYLFLEFIKSNPAGPHIMGILVDSNLVIRCASPVFAVFTWLATHLIRL